MYSTPNTQNYVVSPSRVPSHRLGQPGASHTLEFEEPYQPQVLSEQEERWVGIAFNIRVQYHYHRAPKELLTAWAGACWCSDAPIGDFAYGPGPGDPQLPARLLRDFFRIHEAYVEDLDPENRKLDSMDEETLNRQCLVLALFEQITNQGLDESHGSPIFSPGVQSVQDLINIPNQKLIRELTYRSYMLYDSLSRKRSNQFVDKEGIELFYAAVRPAPHEMAAKLRVMNYGDRLMQGAA